MQTVPEMSKDISSSIKELERKIKKNIIHYSYPEGLKAHFNDKVIETLKKNGIQCCPSAEAGLNNISNDLFNLKRIMISMWGLPFPFFDKKHVNFDLI